MSGKRPNYAGDGSDLIYHPGWSAGRMLCYPPDPRPLRSVRRSVAAESSLAIRLMPEELRPGAEIVLPMAGVRWP